jgi:Ran GTPase-activating protein (RanGAP) involved in mRNA processing and transport
LACLTALTHLDLGYEDIHRGPTDVTVSDEGARALASLVRLTHLDLSEARLSQEGVTALCSPLTALKSLNLSRLTSSHAGDIVVGALCSCPSLSEVCLDNTELSDEARGVLDERSSIQVVLNGAYSHIIDYGNRDSDF